MIHCSNIITKYLPKDRRDDQNHSGLLHNILVNLSSYFKMNKEPNLRVSGDYYLQVTDKLILVFRVVVVHTFNPSTQEAESDKSLVN